MTALTSLLRANDSFDHGGITQLTWLKMALLFVGVDELTKELTFDFCDQVKISVSGLHITN
jgi:hypothetical protein